MLAAYQLQAGCSQPRYTGEDAFGAFLHHRVLPVPDFSPYSQFLDEFYGRKESTDKNTATNCFKAMFGEISNLEKARQ